MTITLIILSLTVGMFIWGRVRSDIVAWLLWQSCLFWAFSLQERLWPVSHRP